MPRCRGWKKPELGLEGPGQILGSNKISLRFGTEGNFKELRIGSSLAVRLKIWASSTFNAGAWEKLVESKPLSPFQTARFNRKWTFG